MSMDYFRRPVLAGNTLRRTQNATIRGSVRRSDADGVSTVPYFPGISGKSLQIKIEGTTYTVNFVSDAFATALSAINAVIGGHGAGVANGEASDTDGTITLVSTSTDGLGNALRSLGSVEIVGGTATTTLGFDITFHSLKAVGGEIVSSPEDRIGNPFRTVLIGRGEGLNADSVNRGMAMLSSNMDVLYAGFNREDAMMMEVTGFTNNNTYLTLPAGTSVPVGLGLLSGSSGRGDLAPFFYLADSTFSSFDHPHQSMVAAVVKGTPVGTYPTGYPRPNQTAWATNAGNNMLGQNVPKLASPVAITSIVEGRYVTCAGTPFTTVAVEDFVEISGATNTDQLDNNGYKWVVERVISSSIISVRPMSKGEMSLVGFTPTEVQPGVDLASTKQAGQTYGNIMVRTGAFATDPVAASLNLVLDPPIPVGSSVRLFMAQPMCVADAIPYGMQSAAGQSLRQLASTLDPISNDLTATILATLSVNTVLTSGSLARLHGRSVSIPARTWLPAEFVTGDNWLCWDSYTGLMKVLNGPSFPNLLPIYNGSSKLIAKVVLSGPATISSVQQIARITADSTRTVTVGVGGQFTSLKEAIEYINAFKTASGETRSEGAYPHFEIVLVSNIVVSSTINVTCGDLMIRGVIPSIKLTCNVGLNVSVFASTHSVTLRDLTLLVTNDSSVLVEAVGAGAFVGTISLENLNTDPDVSTLPFAKLVSTVSDDAHIRIRDCYLYAGGKVIDADRAYDVIVERSTFGYIAIASYPEPVIVFTGTNGWYDVTIRDCDFIAPWVVAGTTPLLVNTKAGQYAIIENCRFSIDNNPSASLSILMSIAGIGLVKNCHMKSGKVSTAVTGGSKDVIVDGCSFIANTAAGWECISVGQFLNSKLTHVDADSGTAGGIAVLMQNTGDVVQGNIIEGPFTVGVQVEGVDECRILDNYIRLTYIANSRPLYGISSSGGSNCEVSGNIVTMATGAFSLGGIYNEGSTGNVISGNSVHLANLTANSVNSYGIDIATSFNTTVVGNRVETYGTQSAYTSNSVTGVFMEGATNAVVDGNNIILPGDATGAHVGIGLGATGATKSSIVGNNVSTYGDPFYSNNMAELSNVIDGNFFEMTRSTGGSFGLAGLVSNNSFAISGPAVAHTCTLGIGSFTGNRFGPVTFNMTGVPGVPTIQMTGNKVFGAFSMVMGATFGYVQFSNNQFSENGTDLFTVSADYIEFRMSGGRAAVTSISNTSGDTYLEDVEFQTLALTNGANSDSSVSVRNCVINDTFSVTSRNFLVNGCTFNGSGTHTFNGNSAANSSCAEVSGCNFYSGSIAVSNTSVFSLLTSKVGCTAVTVSSLNGTGRISSCVFTAVAAITFNYRGSVDACTFRQGANIAALSVDACHFASYLVMSGWELSQSVTNCSLFGQLQFTQDLSDGTSNSYLVSGNRIIINEANIHGIVFPSFSGTKAFYEITITNNFVFLGKTFGNAIQASCIYFPVGVHNTTIVGNNLLTKGGNTSPGGTGTISYGVIEAAAGELRNCVISSNRIHVQGVGLAGWAFAGPLNLSYKYVKTADAQGAAGAGNVFNDNNNISAAGTTGGGVFHQAAGGVFTIP